MKIAKRGHVQGPLAGGSGEQPQSPLLGRSVLERELGLNCERLSVQLCVRIDEVVERIALLRWVEADVSSDRKLQAIVVMRPEKIILLIRMLPSF